MDREPRQRKADIPPAVCPYAVCAAPRTACVARRIVVRAPPPARLGAKEHRATSEDRRTRGRDVRCNPTRIRSREQIYRARGRDGRCTPTPHEPLLLNCGGENHPTARPTRASARATLVPPVALRAGRRLAPRSDERREDATRRGGRPEEHDKAFYHGENVLPRRPPDERAPPRRSRAAQAPRGARACARACLLARRRSRTRRAAKGRRGSEPSPATGRRRERMRRVGTTCQRACHQRTARSIENSK